MGRLGSRDSKIRRQNFIFLKMNMRTPGSMLVFGEGFKCNITVVWERCLKKGLVEFCDPSLLTSAKALPLSISGSLNSTERRYRAFILISFSCSWSNLHVRRHDFQCIKSWRYGKVVPTILDYSPQIARPMLKESVLFTQKANLVLMLLSCLLKEWYVAPDLHCSGFGTSLQYRR